MDSVLNELIGWFISSLIMLNIDLLTISFSNNTLFTNAVSKSKNNWISILESKFSNIFSKRGYVKIWK